MPRRTLAATAAAFALSLLACGCPLLGPQPTKGPAAVVEAPVALPNANGSLKFAVLGDFGTAGRRQYELADRMFEVHKAFPFEIVLLVGDNLYGAERPQDFRSKFETPYKALLDAGVKFYGALGNHDAREQRYYEAFNMEGKLYYSFHAPHEPVRFFVLDSTYPVPEQIAWLQKELEDSTEDWKIAYFHHPPYSSGGRHGSDIKLRQTLEPLFVKYNVSVVFTGHDHFYERIKPQQGIVYFVVGSGGMLAPGDIKPNSPITDKGFDRDRAFLVAEIKDDAMTFQAISRTGEVVDSGIILRRKQQP
ncbi:MAG TPA: metallophosphoesterase [Candidatus Polarisedimenticolaceae bacterium]|nr:metallophosphoesterase [Candidatus Polarisedimenticolaceae bacterium]